MEIKYSMRKQEIVNIYDQVYSVPALLIFAGPVIIS